MPWDFPASPSEGAVYTPAGGPSYTYTGGIWRILPTPQTALSSKSIGDTPPLNPVHGQSWWNSVDGTSYIYYVDASGAPGQWVQESDTSLPDAPVDGVRYVRKDGVWTSIGPGSTVIATTSGFQPSLTFAIPTGATRCRLSGFLTPAAASTGNNIAIRFSTDGGATYKAGATDYTYQALAGVGATTSGSFASAAQILLTATGAVGGVASRIINTEMLFNHNGSSEVAQTVSTSGGYNGTNPTTLIYAGYCNFSPNNVTHFRLFCMDGNSAGTVQADFNK